MSIERKAHNYRIQRFLKKGLMLLRCFLSFYYLYGIDEVASLCKKYRHFGVKSVCALFPLQCSYMINVLTVSNTFQTITSIWRYAVYTRILNLIPVSRVVPFVFEHRTSEPNITTSQFDGVCCRYGIFFLSCTEPKLQNVTSENSFVFSQECRPQRFISGWLPLEPNAQIALKTSMDELVRDSGAIKRRLCLFYAPSKNSIRPHLL